MTALDDMLAKADGQLRMCRERSPYATMPCESTACQLARFAIAVLDALEERGRVPGNVELAIIRAAITERLK